MPRTRTYSELVTLLTFEERFDYLKLSGSVGQSTFGFDRYLNQRFYTSREWRQVREHVIARDLGLDLAVEGYEIHDKIIIHHMNPMVADDLVHSNMDNLNPEYLITTNLDTHNAIHYGGNLRPRPSLTVREPNDTKLW